MRYERKEDKGQIQTSTWMWGGIAGLIAGKNLSLPPSLPPSLPHSLPHSLLPYFPPKDRMQTEDCSSAVCFRAVCGMDD